MLTRKPAPDMVSSPDIPCATTTENGFIHEVAHRAYLANHPNPEDCAYYLCGPPLMVRAVLAMLDSLGVDPDAIYFDDLGS